LGIEPTSVRRQVVAFSPQMQSAESSIIYALSSCSAPSSRASGRQATKIVFKSRELAFLASLESTKHDRNSYSDSFPPWGSLRRFRLASSRRLISWTNTCGLAGFCSFAACAQVHSNGHENPSLRLPRGRSDFLRIAQVFCVLNLTPAEASFSRL
jgi:hypothetical protein